MRRILYVLTIVFLLVAIVPAFGAKELDGVTLIAKVMAAKDHPPLDVLMIDSPSMPTVIEAGIVEPITEISIRSFACACERRFTG
jgi:hypothetical protein